MELEAEAGSRLAPADPGGCGEAPPAARTSRAPQACRPWLRGTLEQPAGCLLQASGYCNCNCRLSEDRLHPLPTQFSKTWRGFKLGHAECPMEPGGCLEPTGSQRFWLPLAGRPLASRLHSGGSRTQPHRMPDTHHGSPTTHLRHPLSAVRCPSTID
jgi:hypothetical protein